MWVATGQLFCMSYTLSLAGCRAVSSSSGQARAVAIVNLCFSFVSWLHCLHSQVFHSISVLIAFRGPLFTVGLILVLIYCNHCSSSQSITVWLSKTLISHFTVETRDCKSGVHWSETGFLVLKCLKPIFGFWVSYTVEFMMSALMYAYAVCAGKCSHC